MKGGYRTQHAVRSCPEKAGLVFGCDLERPQSNALFDFRPWVGPYRPPPRRPNTRGLVSLSHAGSRG